MFKSTFPVWQHKAKRWLVHCTWAVGMLALHACSNLQPPLVVPPTMATSEQTTAPPAPAIAGAPNTGVQGAQGVEPSTGAQATALTRTPRRRAIPDGPPRDLWERIRQGFAMPELEGAAAERAEQAAQAYTRSGLLQRSEGRAQLYLYPFVAEAEKRGLPLELALLPYVESALNPHARSPVGAVGACQFMPATGRRFDLVQSAWVDQRRDVSRCANAMFDYLAENYMRFGKWHLALAAYNWGEGAVTRALEKNRAAGLPTSFENLRMPRETQNYVPALIGLAAVVDDPERFGISLPALSNLPPWVDVPLPADIDVHRVLKLAGISQAEFERLNPGIFRPVIPKAVQSSIALPPAAAERFAKALAQQRVPLATWGAWRVPRTQRLTLIAKTLRTQATTLALANNIPLGHLVLAGSVLAVPKMVRQDIDEHSASQGVVRTALPPPVHKMGKRAKREAPPRPRLLGKASTTPKNQRQNRISG